MGPPEGVGPSIISSYLLPKTTRKLIVRRLLKENVVSPSNMQVCHEHYYCICGACTGFRVCHYCRKQSTFYKKHYLCLDCRVGWKSKYDLVLRPSVDGAQLQDVWTEFRGGRCPRCGIDGDEVGRDFRVPKRTDKKAWKQLEQEKAKHPDDFYLYMREKYTYNCGGGNRRGPVLYGKRTKPPWKKGQ